MPSGYSTLTASCPHCGRVGQPGSIRTHALWCNPANPVERFWAKVDKRGPDDCWNWKGQFRWDGYGRFLIQRKPVWAHRYSYELHSGPIPKGLHVLHSCDNPACVNPKHLRVGTHLDNMKDMWNKRRSTTEELQKSRLG